MEGHRPNTYGDAFADVYDAWYSDVTDATATAELVDAEAPPGTILELGVGSGRLAYPLLARDRVVIGLDASRQMLQRCERRPNLHLVEGDMAALPLHGQVAGALCAFNTLFNLTTAEAQQAVFTQTAQLLMPGGVLVIEAITGTDLGDGPRSSVGVSTMKTDEVVLSATLLDHEEQTISGQHIQLRENGVTLRPWALRWATPDQLDRMAELVGLRLDTRLADWDRSAFDATATKHISLYRKPAAT
ncbi:MAG: class I SAM-dependent methyltransferase [Acidimicrobiales bacterium]